METSETLVKIDKLTSFIGQPFPIPSLTYIPYEYNLRQLLDAPG
jgi:hypothetical protein